VSLIQYAQIPKRIKKMRIEYKKSIFEKIEDAKIEAIKNNMKIEKLWLNEKEWKEFSTWCLKNLCLYKNSINGRLFEEQLRNFPNEISYDDITVGLEK
jgi:ectoine hydroxylase-related dioxygenase (phytanoyl-CoA dioxygenase family)